MEDFYKASQISMAMDGNSLQNTPIRNKEFPSHKLGLF